MLYITILLALLAALAYNEIKTAKIRKQVKHTAGEPTLPILGNLHQLGRKPTVTTNYLFDLFYKYNFGNLCVSLGYHLQYLVVDTKDVEFILSTNPLVNKSDIYKLLHPWLGEGLITSSGAKWQKHRKMITPSFNFNILNSIQDVMKTNSEKFIGKLREISRGDNIFDLQEVVNNLTLDVICETAMGVSINALHNPHSDFVLAVKFMCYNSYKRLIHPIKRYELLYRLYPEYWEYRKQLQIYKDFIYGIIDKRIEAKKSSQDTNPTNEQETEFRRRKLGFLDSLLEATVDGRPLTRKEIYDEVATLMFAGHDTTTSSITFAIYLLSRHVDIQQKVLEEQCRIMAGNLKGNATLQDLNEMKYLDCVIKESMRIYPPVLFFGRNVEKEYNMNGKLIPAQTSLLIFVLAMNYNEAIYPDPYRFDPKRFDTDQRTTTQNPFEYVPFGGGQRNCMGQKFAMLEVKTVISKIVRNFQILPPEDGLESKDGYISTLYGQQRARAPKPDKYVPTLLHAITLRAESGLYLRLRERE